jgi:hypothetical protein
MKFFRVSIFVIKIPVWIGEATMNYGHIAHAIGHMAKESPVGAAGATVGTVIAATTGVAIAPLLLVGALIGLAIGKGMEADEAVKKALK